MQKGGPGTPAQEELAQPRDRAAVVGLGVPERAREACMHSGNGGIAGHVRDLQAPSLIFGQLQHCVDVDAIRRGIDGPNVIAGSEKMRGAHGS